MTDTDFVHDLIFKGRIKELSELLAAKPYLAQARNSDGDLPIHSACWAKQPLAVGALSVYSVDLNAKGCYGRTPLHYAVHEGSAISVPLVASLISRGADPTIRDDNGFTPAEWAKIEMEDGLPQVLQLLKDPFATRKSGDDE